MEVKEKQFIVTEKWLEKKKACEDGLRAFKKYFPNGGEALEVLKRCGELCYFGFGEWLVNHLPPIYPPLELNTFVGNLFYPNDVHIKGDIPIQEFMYIKGSLKIDGKLTVNKYGDVYADFVNADEICLNETAQIYSNTKAKTKALVVNDRAVISGDIVADNININYFAKIFGNTKAKVVNFDGGYIMGDVDADVIINAGGLITGNVNVIRIKNTNGGRVDGKRAYKNPRSITKIS